MSPESIIPVRGYGFSDVQLHIIARAARPRNDGKWRSRTSAAKPGAGVSGVPGFRCAHPGYETAEVICPSGCLAKGVSSPFSKNISVLQNGKSPYIHPRPTPPRGVGQRHRRGAGCGGRRGHSRRERLKRTAKSCGPGASTPASSLAGSFLRGDGDKPARSPGRARSKP